MCYPGKILHLGESCLPLFKESKNLRYETNIFFTASAKFNSSVDKIHSHVFETLSEKIKSKFRVDHLLDFFFCKSINVQMEL
jgi:hypothetical protein